MLTEDYFGEKLFFFAAGIVVGAPTAVFFESVSHLWFTVFGVATLVAPLVEEFCKACTLFYRYERPGRILVRNGFLAGLGFGLLSSLYTFMPAFRFCFGCLQSAFMGQVRRSWRTGSTSARR